MSTSDHFGGGAYLLLLRSDIWFVSRRYEPKNNSEEVLRHHLGGGLCDQVI
jgi:hypothetical protein